MAMANDWPLAVLALAIGAAGKTVLTPAGRLLINPNDSSGSQGLRSLDDRSALRLCIDLAAIRIPLIREERASLLSNGIR